MPNRLAGATSPYLQHPRTTLVDGRGGDEPPSRTPTTWSLARGAARTRGADKPILLSIGYSACHWCHVMAHESFEDPAVAAAMNDAFVNVKVDREERPDLDQIYQTAHALLTRRSGGWPLTMFLTPGRRAVLRRHLLSEARPLRFAGFLELLPKVANAYRQQGDRLAEQTARLAEAMAGLEPAGGARRTGRTTRLARVALKRSFDPVHGGFGAAPKFPHAAELEYCLHAYAGHGDAEALAVVRTTLDRMADGGIHDQLGGGFCRYSVDAQWSIPHFEKMLYDNGPLLGLYADLAARHRRAPLCRRRARHRRLAGARDARRTAPSFRASTPTARGTKGSSTCGRATRPGPRRPPRSSPSPRRTTASTWRRTSRARRGTCAWRSRSTRSPRGLESRCPTRRRGSPARGPALFAARAKRVRPGRDDKILTSWNALAIAGLARAARALDEPRWADLAFAAADSLKRTAWRDGRLLATRRGERADLNAYLDDHAFLLAALVELMQTRFRRADYDWARALADALLERFEDREHGGFWFTSHDHERLFHRTKPGHDNATPSGNGVAATALAVFGHLSGDLRYVESARRTVALFAPRLAESPGGYSTLLAAALTLDTPPASVLLAGAAADCATWQRTLEATYRPDVRVLDLAACPTCRRPWSRAPRRRPARSPGSAAARPACRRSCPSWTSRRRWRRRAPESGRIVRFRLPGGRRPRTVAEARRRRAHPPPFHGVAMKAVLVSLAGAALLASGAAHAALDNAKAEAMMKKDGCAACHAIDKKLVGPSYLDVANKYRNDKGAAANLAKKVKAGGSGVWGQIPMPPNAAVSDADIKDLVEWILTLKK